MRLTEILKPKNIKVPLTSTEKQDVIAELVQLLADHGEVNHPERVLKAVLEREGTRTTGIGNGLAIPHGKTDGVDHLVMAVGKPAEPVDFQAVDGRPVSIIWLLSSPPEKTGPHITALARISRMMTIDTVRRDLLAAPDAGAMYEIIATQDEQM